jgi:hypothetical protein
MKQVFLGNIQHTLIDHDAGNANGSEFQKP